MYLRGFAFRTHRTRQAAITAADVRSHDGCTCNGLR
jgi:hypothetical protein